MFYGENSSGKPQRKIMLSGERLQPTVENTLDDFEFDRSEQWKGDLLRTRDRKVNTLSGMVIFLSELSSHSEGQQAPGLDNPGGSLHSQVLEAAHRSSHLNVELVIENYRLS